MTKAIKWFALIVLFVIMIGMGALGYLAHRRVLQISLLLHHNFGPSPDLTSLTLYIVHGMHQIPAFRMTCLCLYIDVIELTNRFYGTFVTITDSVGINHL